MFYDIIFNMSIQPYKFVPMSTPFEPSLGAKGIAFITSPKAMPLWLGAGASALTDCSKAMCLLAMIVAYVVYTLLIKTLSGGSTLRSAAFNEAEHLSKKEVMGGLPFITVPPVIKALDKMDSNNALAAKSALEGLLAYDAHFERFGFNHLLMRDIGDTIQKMKPGQIIAIPLGFMSITLEGHVIVGSIQCVEEGKFILRIHNGGEGVERHHYRRTEQESGRQLYQTTLEIGAVSHSKLLDFIKSAATNSTFYRKHSTEKMYSLIDPLETSILPPNEDARYWMREQSGNSCSGYSIKCFLKFMLSAEEFRQYRIHFLELAIAELGKGLKSGHFYERTREHQLVFSELCTKYRKLTNCDIDPSAGQIESSSMLAHFASRLQSAFWTFVFRTPINSNTGSSKAGADSSAKLFQACKLLGENLPSNLRAVVLDPPSVVFGHDQEVTDEIHTLADKMVSELLILDPKQQLEKKIVRFDCPQTIPLPHQRCLEGLVYLKT